MIKQLEKGIHGLAMLLYELRLREKDIIQNLRPLELIKKREEYREELAHIIGELERKKHSAPELFSPEDEAKHSGLITDYRYAYLAAFTSQYDDELAMIEKSIIFLDKVGQDTTKLLEYYERINE